MKTRKSGNIKFISIKSIEDLQIVIGKSVDNVFPKHVHKKFCIGLIEDGNALFVIKNDIIRVGKGFIYLINPDEAHQIRPSNPEGFNHIVFCFGINFIRDFFDTDINSFWLNTPIVYNEIAWKKISEFRNLVFELHSKIDLEYEIMNVFTELYQYFSFGQLNNFNFERQSYNISKVSTYIMENCKNNISLHELAVYAGMSKFHFSRVFKKEVGISPYDYQIQSKLKLARDLLLNKQSVADVAMELGFTDQSHFTRFFKKNTGVTPAQFKKLNIAL
ncbi:AraC family transcriptional regulator [Desulfosporosinus sp. FKA]|uniref:AraC family transcriptional regulator n=1 Tax=Desulfosporosinus sp. FKA TaxID=1969834 RepID=UPI000B4A114D|nr:AraC family transcriptional regulator [Desulfosporosinus sp. FKA]